jgi:prevent-host-death family protein
MSTKGAGPVPKAVNIHEAKTHFSKLIARVLAGEEVVIAKAGKPVARLVPAEPKRKKRIAGLGRGKIWYSDDFHEPLSEEELKDWYESKLFPDE